MRLEEERQGGTQEAGWGGVGVTGATVSPSPAQNLPEGTEGSPDPGTCL